MTQWSPYLEGTCLPVLSVTPLRGTRVTERRKHVLSQGYPDQTTGSLVMDGSIIMYTNGVDLSFSFFIFTSLFFLLQKTIPVMFLVSGVFIMMYDFITTQTLANATPQYQARPSPLSTNHLRNLNFSSSIAAPSISESLPDDLVKLRPRVNNIASTL